MDTPTQETTTEQTDETATGDTSDVTQEDADTRRIEDKQAYLKDLDRQIKEAEANRNKTKKSEPDDEDSVMTWLTVNSDDLKLVTKEYNEELAFYKSHKIPVTNDIRDRALQSAKARKGVRGESVERQGTTSEVQGEMRKGTAVMAIPAKIAEANPKMTLDDYKKFKAEFDARDKERR